jgi:hypothetical protein
LAKGDVIVSVKYREVFSPAIFLGDEMLEIGHWKNADFHPFSTLTESINQSIGCQYCRAKGRQPRFNAQVALHNYVNKIIRDMVPQKNLLGNVEITVIRFFFYIYHKFILTG